jgi:peptidoglycan hydrolase-like protein with peptidoglycan-binding domain
MKLKRVLSLKMSGEDITFLQSKLKELGFFNDRIDGYFGQNTLISVTNFQRAVNTKADGNVGSLTWGKMMNYGKEPLLRDGIPHEISFTSDKGLVIYDHLISDEEYIKEETIKDTIFLHHTAGGSRPDWSINGWEKDYIKDKSGNPILGSDGLIQPLRVGTSYVIGRKSSTTDDNLWDGKILRAFEDKYWAYHLGINTNNSLKLNSNSIAIEFCNYGPLTIGKDGRFYNWVNKPINEKEVVKLDKPFKGYEYYERYTDAQLESARNLIFHLINKYDIKIEGKIFNEKWFDYNTSWINNGGIRSHAQVRRDKFDIFPQKEMIQMLNSL